MEKQLIEEISDGVATLTFNRPGHRLNALSTPIMEGLLEALPRLAASPARGRTSIALPAHHRERAALLKHERIDPAMAPEIATLPTGHDIVAGQRPAMGRVPTEGPLLQLRVCYTCTKCFGGGSSLPQDDLIGPS